jgi:hypothetical protein
MNIDERIKSLSEHYEQLRVISTSDSAPEILTAMACLDSALVCLETYRYNELHAVKQ